MRHTVYKMSVASGLFVLLAASTTAFADAPFPTGANALFAGHSFFIPASGNFNQLATDNGYADHEYNAVFSPGPGGSPGSLWDNTTNKQAVESVLDGGDVELFGLTTAFQVGSTVEDYSQWIDLALGYNPNTEFVIGVPWVIGGPSVFGNAEDFAAANTMLAAEEWAKVQALRAAHPEATIHYIDYSLVGTIMWEMYEAGELPDITGLTPGNGVTPDEALFEDPLIGHGGPMMVDVAALVWMELLYGADVESLTYTDYETDVTAIVNEVVAYNQQFQVVPEPSGLVALATATAVMLATSARRR